MQAQWERPFADDLNEFRLELANFKGDVVPDDIKKALLKIFNADELYEDEIYKILSRMTRQDFERFSDLFDREEFGSAIDEYRTLDGQLNDMRKKINEMKFNPKSQEAIEAIIKNLFLLQANSIIVKFEEIIPVVPKEVGNLLNLFDDKLRAINAMFDVTGNAHLGTVPKVETKSQVPGQGSAKVGEQEEKSLVKTPKSKTQIVQKPAIITESKGVGTATQDERTKSITNAVNNEVNLSKLTDKQKTEIVGIIAKTYTGLDKDINECASAIGTAHSISSIIKDDGTVDTEGLKITINTHCAKAQKGGNYEAKYMKYKAKYMHQKYSS